MAFIKTLFLVAFVGYTFALHNGPAQVVQAADMLSTMGSQAACSIDGPASCHNSTPIADLCCFEAPGGLLMQTQFWDAQPALGSPDSWTIHGLWPNNCDGTFAENCDPSRAYTDIGDLLAEQGAEDTLAFMQKYWVEFNNQDEEFWEHEWKTHGTCYSTLNPSCLPEGSPRGAEAVAFFEAVVKLFKSLPTYDFLADAGITPTTDKTFTLTALTNALRSATGVTPALNCEGGKLSAIEWYFNLKGSVIDGEFVPIDAISRGSCRQSGIQYLPKSRSPITTTSAHPSPTAGPGRLPSKGTIHSSLTGGLLSGGTWSMQSPATYHFSGTIRGFTMSTSKGDCSIAGGELICGSDARASSFSAVSSGGELLLSLSGSTTFSSNGVPSGSAQERVFSGGERSVQYTLTIVS